MKRGREGGLDLITDILFLNIYIYIYIYIYINIYVKLQTSAKLTPGFTNEWFPMKSTLVV